MAKSMKHKKDYTALAFSLAADIAAVDNLHNEDGDGEQPFSDHEGRVLMARSLRTNRVRLVADALRMDEDQVRENLATLDAAAKAKAAAEIEPDAEEAA